MHPLLLVLAVLSSGTAEQPPPSEMTGAVSPLLPSLCRPMTDGAGADEVLRCAGLVGTDVFVRGGATDRQVALGQPVDFTPPPPDGARLGQSVSWRLLGDKPVAAVLRYRFPDAANAPHDVLLVLKPPAEGGRGCPVGAVEDVADPAGTASDRAAALADRRAPLFRCGKDRPRLEGAWSPGGRARIETWLGAVATEGR